MAPIAFVTFGMFIIDEIDYDDGKKRQLNLIGGAGVYAALGARLCAGIEHSRCVSWIVDIGSDFPRGFKDLIDSWQTSCRFRTDSSRLTTRAWNGYGPNEHRLFKYLTPKIRLEVSSLDDQQVLSSSFHMVCSPSRCMELMENLKRRRQELNDASLRPVVVWEPIPDLCTPEELQNLQQAAQNVTVVSPNADELASFFTDQAHESQAEMVKRFMGWNSGHALSTHAIIREGADGSTVYLAPAILGNHQLNANGPAKVHFPAFHTKDEAFRVVDPTGGGNTYLGGLAVGMTTLLDNSIITKDVVQRLPELGIKDDEVDTIRRVLIGALYGVIAASYAIEQSGVPSLGAISLANSLHTDYWNGEAFTDRMTGYLERELQYIAQQLVGIS